MNGRDRDYVDWDDLIQIGEAIHQWLHSIFYGLRQFFAAI
jgi:hypothetical protein